MCNTCSLIKRLNEFNSRKDSKDGLTNRCKKCTKEYFKKYKNENELKIKKYQEDYRKINVDNRIAYNKSYSDKNKEVKREYDKNYYQINKKNINLKIKTKRENNKLFRLSGNLRSLIRASFITNGYKKNSKTYKILGCSFEEFKQHLESKFESWMNWENYGKYNGELNYGWDIDHIIPSSSGINENEMIELNHYTNLQPLCSHINRKVKRNIIFV